MHIAPSADLLTVSSSHCHELDNCHIVTFHRLVTIVGYYYFTRNHFAEKRVAVRASLLSEHIGHGTDKR